MSSGDRISRVLAKLEAVKKSGKGFTARCPAHEDKNPSLSVRETADGRVLLHCHKGCRPEDVLRAIDLEWKHVMPEPPPRSRRAADGGRRPAPPVPEPVAGQLRNGSDLGPDPTKTITEIWQRGVQDAQSGEGDLLNGFAYKFINEHRLREALAQGVVGVITADQRLPSPMSAWWQNSYQLFAVLHSSQDGTPLSIQAHSAWSINGPETLCLKGRPISGTSFANPRALERIGGSGDSRGDEVVVFTEGLANYWAVCAALPQCCVLAAPGSSAIGRCVGPWARDARVVCAIEQDARSQQRFKSLTRVLRDHGARGVEFVRWPDGVKDASEFVRTHGPERMHELLAEHVEAASSKLRGATRPTAGPDCGVLSEVANQPRNEHVGQSTSDTDTPPTTDDDQFEDECEEGDEEAPGADDGVEPVGPPGLLDHHRASLERGSAISPEVIAARGYVTATTKKHLEAVGFGKSQRIVPSLLIPIHDVHGRVALHVHRPDRPRELKGKVRKYEFPAKRQMVIDVPPAIRAQLGDPSIPLYVTEGSKKADSAVSHGLCCIALLGVWNWRGTNSSGGKTELPDWEAIALNDRAVFVVFDSDVTTKPQVRGALARLRALLESRGAHVKVVVLPSDGDGEAKTGLDDFLAGGGSADDLNEYAIDDLPPPAPVTRSPDNYVVAEGGMWWVRKTRDGTEHVPLSNFVARIVHEGLVDDGVEQCLHFDIKVELPRETRSLRVRADEFDEMNWVAKLGAAAIVEAGPSIRNHLAVAIRKLSAPTRSHVYAHVGWRLVEDQWMFLHAGGAIGPNGQRSDVEVLAPETLKSLVLPERGDEDQLRTDVRAVVSTFADLGPDGVVFPLLGAAFRAAFGGCDFSLFIAGPSGAFKSQLAYLTQSFFGAGFARGPAPCSWHSTPNAINELAFSAKDCPLLVDDFIARGGRDREMLLAAAERVFRGAGNRTGRQRLTSTGEARPERPPRALLLATGEDFPEGHSLVARLFIVTLRLGDVYADDLTRAQDAAADGAYARVMSGFLEYLAVKHDEHVATFRQRVRERRDRIECAAHRRVAGSAADLIEGVRVFTDFAVLVGAIDADKAEELNLRGEAAIHGNVTELAATLREAEPVDTFLQLLRTILSTGLGFVVDSRTGEMHSLVKHPAHFGWEGPSCGRSDRGRLIGWARLEGDRPALYLDLTATLAVITTSLGTAANRLMIGERALRQRLAERGLIAIEVESSGGVERRRLEPKRTVVGASRRVTDLDLRAVWPDEASDQEVSNG